MSSPEPPPGGAVWTPNDGGGGSFRPVDGESDVSSVEDMRGMFSGAPPGGEIVGTDPAKSSGKIGKAGGKVGNALYRTFIRPNWLRDAQEKYDRSYPSESAKAGGSASGPDNARWDPKSGASQSQPGHFAEGRLPSLPELPHTRVPTVEEMREYLHPFDNDVRYSGMPPVDAGESGVSSVEDMRGMFGGAPPGGAAIYSPRGGGSYRPITMTDAPPSSWQPTPIPENANPFRPGGTSVADIQDPMARRFDALSPADQKLLIRLGNGVKSGELSPVAVVREMQRLMIDENSYGPVGSLPGEAGFFPPNLGQPTPFEAAAGRVGSALAPAVDTWAVLSQINQTNQVIDKAPERWRGGMTLETIGTVGTAASAAGAAATGLPLAGVAGIGIAGASVPMAAATTFGSASGQEGSDPWGGVPHPGIDPRGRKASDPARPGRSDSTAPPKGMSDLSHLLMPDHDAMGYAHGVALGQHIKTQMDQVLKQLPGVPEFKAHFTDHIQNGGVQP